MDYLQYRRLLSCAALPSLRVLNLVINGLPSILEIIGVNRVVLISFKPCYKWITFNTEELSKIN